MNGLCLGAGSIFLFVVCCQYYFNIHFCIVWKLTMNTTDDDKTYKLSIHNLSLSIWLWFFHADPYYYWISKRKKTVVILYPVCVFGLDFSLVVWSYNRFICVCVCGFSVHVLFQNLVKKKRKNFLHMWWIMDDSIQFTHTFICIIELEHQ